MCIFLFETLYSIYFSCLGASCNISAMSHGADIFFSFVLSGSMELHVEEHGNHQLQTGYAYVMPPHTKHRFTHVTPDLELLEVVLPGDINTYCHNDM